jgi:hypothetical protein
MNNDGKRKLNSCLEGYCPIFGDDDEGDREGTERSIYFEYPNEYSRGTPIPTTNGAREEQ